MKTRTREQYRKSIVFGLIIDSWAMAFVFAGIIWDGFSWFRLGILVVYGILIINARVRLGEELRI